MTEPQPYVFTAMNVYDPLDTIELCAANRCEAALILLTALGWSLSEEPEENDDDNEALELLC